MSDHENTSKSEHSEILSVQNESVRDSEVNPISPSGGDYTTITKVGCPKNKSIPPTITRGGCSGEVSRFNTGQHMNIEVDESKIEIKMENKSEVAKKNETDDRMLDRINCKTNSAKSKLETNSKMSSEIEGQKLFENKHRHKTNF